MCLDRHDRVVAFAPAGEENDMPGCFQICPHGGGLSAKLSYTDVLGYDLKIQLPWLMLINFGHTKLKKRLLEYAAKFPELCQQTDNDEHGGLRFEIDKSRISIRLTAPYSNERRKLASEAAKKRGIICQIK